MYYLLGFIIANTKAIELIKLSTIRQKPRISGLFLIDIIKIEKEFIIFLKSFYITIIDY
jgi:hypothetical protein